MSSIPQFVVDLAPSDGMDMMIDGNDLHDGGDYYDDVMTMLCITGSVGVTVRRIVLHLITISNGVLGSCGWIAYGMAS